MIGQASAIVDHASVEIGNDVWTGPHVYVTDANHGYEDVTEPIGASSPPPVRCASARARGWVLPGMTIGRHVVVGEGAVVAEDLPDDSVAVDRPARVVHCYIDGAWKSAD